MPGGDAFLGLPVEALQKGCWVVFADAPDPATAELPEDNNARTAGIPIFRIS